MKLIMLVSLWFYQQTTVIHTIDNNKCLVTLFMTSCLICQYHSCVKNTAKGILFDVKKSVIDTKTYFMQRSVYFRKDSTHDQFMGFVVINPPSVCECFSLQCIAQFVVELNTNRDV